ncbi:MAG: FMN-binding protein [Muribaculaceae bacterium]|nr:FMN-binding protein [Muribaculaceae bacterium]
MRKVVIALSLLLLATASVSPVQGKTKKKQASKPAKAQVIYTGDLAKKVYGYNGPTPLNIHIENGRIVRIEALPNNETPQYFNRVAAKIFPLYEGKTVAEARQLHVDAVTGATYSSEAVIKNIQAGLEQANSSPKRTKKKNK